MLLSIDNTFCQDNINININIVDSVIHLKFKPLNLSFTKNILLSRYNHSFKIKVEFDNLSDTTQNLYYVYDDIFPSYNNYTSSGINSYTEIIQNKIHENDSTKEDRLLYLHSMGLRYVICNDKNIVVHQSWSSGHEPTGTLTKILFPFNIVNSILYQCFVNHKRPKFAYPLVLKNNQKYIKTFKCRVIRRNIKSWVFGRKENLCYPSICQNGNCYEGLPKGVYFMYLYYWMDLSPQIATVDYFYSTYPIHIKNAPQYYILKNIESNENGIPFKGYVKSNSIKLIVE